MLKLQYGRAPETVEVDLEQVDPLRIGEMTPAERGALIAQLLEQFPHLWMSRRDV